MPALLARRLLRTPQLCRSRRWAASRAAHTWTTARVRREFLAFFQERGHEHLPSSSLVPTTDPTLLFTNAGMVQFKGWFADTELASSRRVVTVQRCMRAGGKHNDLDNVGQPLVIIRFSRCSVIFRSATRKRLQLSQRQQQMETRRR